MFRLLTIGDTDLSGASSSMHPRGGPAWYSTPVTTGAQSACMSRTDSAAAVAGDTMVQPDIMEDFTPFMENTLGQGSSGHAATRQQQRGRDWR